SLWKFSILLESVAIVPQLYLLKKQGVIDLSMSYYLLTLGSYRTLYIFNWLYRYQTEGYWNSLSFLCGCLQTMIYLHFFIYNYPKLSKKFY
ncbi:unnamed protein product, partial [Didymodactylos carnosus]